MTPRAFIPWYRQPLWWLTIIVGVPLASAIVLMLWALIDRQPPLSYRGLHAGAYDPATRILTLQWTVKRRRYCAGEMLRTIEAEIGGTTILPTVVIDPDTVSAEIREQRIGSTYVGNPNLVEIPPTIGGTLKLTTVPRFWCSPMQRYAPIEIPVPPIIFTMPDPKTWAGGGLPVQVGPLPE